MRVVKYKTNLKSSTYRVFLKYTDEEGKKQDIEGICLTGLHSRGFNARYTDVSFSCRMWHNQFPEDKMHEYIGLVEKWTGCKIQADFGDVMKHSADRSECLLHFFIKGTYTYGGLYVLVTLLRGISEFPKDVANCIEFRRPVYALFVHGNSGHCFTPSRYHKLGSSKDTIHTYVNSKRINVVNLIRDIMQEKVSPQSTIAIGALSDGWAKWVGEKPRKSRKEFHTPSWILN